MHDIRECQAFLDAMPDAIAILDGEGTIVTVNACWRAFARDNGGDTKSCYVGRNYLEICRDADGESSAEAALVGDGLTELLAGGSEFRCEYPCHSPSEKRWFELVAFPVETDGGRYAAVSHRCISTRQVQQEAVIESRPQADVLAALVATSSDAIMSCDLDGRIVTWNQGAEKLYGYAAEEAVGQSMEILYPQDWPLRIREYLDLVISGKATHFDVVRRTKAGESRHISVSAAPVRNLDGEVVSISNFHRDVTDQKQIEEQLRLTTGELTHRTKNMLAVITAIERQTARSVSTIEEFHEKFSARLRSLVASNELLASQSWSTVPLQQLCRSQLATFTDGKGEHISVEGPPVVLQPEAVQAIGLSLHELATNAVKYGALSRPSGHVAVTWQVESGKDGRRLNVTWRESGVELDGAPERTGFGHSVVTKFAEQSLSAEVDFSFQPTGVVWSIAVPEAHFVTGDRSVGSAAAD